MCPYTRTGGLTSTHESVACVAGRTQAEETADCVSALAADETRRHRKFTLVQV